MKRVRESLKGLKRLERRHKNIIHGTVIALIGLSLVHEGAGHADWAFLVLSLLCEIPDGGAA